MADAGHIVVAGGGVVGLACALELHSRGLRVTLYDAGEPMREASWAAGGMLAVEDPANPPVLAPLARLSRAIYDEFVSKIAAFCGEIVPFRTRQTLQLVEPGHTPAGGVLLTADEARQLVPALATEGMQYVLLQEASLDPRDLCRTLPRAAMAAGVALRPHQPVLAVEEDGAGVRITTPAGTVRADALLNTSGAWAGGFAGAPAVKPAKGQMLVIEQPAASPLPCVLRSSEIYLIPRGDGRIVIGATVEDAGFSKQVDDASLGELRRRAAQLWPPASEARQLESWAGLRPGTPDALPMLGRYGAGSRTYIAAGHYRNGILLAPGTARVMAELIAGDVPSIDLRPFDPARRETHRQRAAEDGLHGAGAACDGAAYDKDFAATL